MDNTLSKEHYRLRSLRSLAILDTPAEHRFDQFTRLAAAAFGVPIALVSLVDSDRQWFKSRVGLAASETHRSLSFCSLAVESDVPLVVADARQDARFSENALVLGAPHIRFYAGQPIRSHDGFAVGTLCIIDTKPRNLTDEQLSMLRSLAKLVEHELNHDAAIVARSHAESALHALNASLDKRVQERAMALQEKNDALNREIRQRAEVEHKLHSSEQMLRTITDNVPVLISYLDVEFRFQFANAVYKEWLGQRNADMIGNTMEAVFGAAFYEERKPSLMQALAGHMTNFEAKVQRKGHERILNTTYIPHHRDGEVVGIYVLATDSTASREHERQLLALANADPLTGLPNRRVYEFHLQKALALSRRQGTRLGLMYLDLDNFKKINDTYGHGAGDAVLIEFGKRVKSALRESDILARLAGDEFTVVLEGVGTVEDCEAVARKILDVLTKPFAVNGKAIQVSVSIGVALGGADATADSLAHEADAALYTSKRKGKRQFCVIALASRAGPWRETRAMAQ
jgi:diguanylate cyclase (GGDEF)-like protein/PAS domain S-box-containing protein